MLPLLGHTPDELREIAAEAGLPAFAGKQIARWLYTKGARSVDEMTDLSKAGREALKARCEVGVHAPADCRISADGTRKYLFRTADGHYVETVYIPDGDRATLCVSSQVGCKMGCTFCMTGRQGFAASLTAAEILNQIYALPERERLTNIVFMGQGEPLDNVDAVLRACEVLTAGWGLAWSPKRITVSSVGLRKGLERFIAESRCSLAISLHHPVPARRAEMMPAERAMGIAEIVAVLRRHKTAFESQRRLTFEYIVFGGLNDDSASADTLADLLRGLPCRVNLIRFHPIPSSPFCGTDETRLAAFRDRLCARGLTATIRASRGQDIEAACGLLSTKKQEENRRKEVLSR